MHLIAFLCLIYAPLYCFFTIKKNQPMRVGSFLFFYHLIFYLVKEFVEAFNIKVGFDYIAEAVACVFG